MVPGGDRKPGGRREIVTKRVTEVRLSGDEISIDLAFPAFMLRERGASAPGGMDTYRLKCEVVVDTEIDPFPSWTPWVRIPSPAP